MRKERFLTAAVSQSRLFPVDLSTKDGSTCSDASKRRANVMVLSWLTATNNSGRFVFSINRGRHSATNVVPIDESSGKARTGVDFVLSIPVQGMEQLVLDVGGTSGKWGSKFVADHNHDDAEPSNETGEDDECRAADVDLTSMSNRQTKKLKRMRLAKGIPNLEAAPIGHSDASSREKNLLFAINGTCSHIHCRTYEARMLFLMTNLLTSSTRNISSSWLRSLMRMYIHHIGMQQRNNFDP